MAVNWDFSNIIMGNRSGQNIGRGIEQAASSIARGISNYRADQKEKEASQSAADLIKQIGGQYGINTADDGEIKAIIKATGGGEQALQFLTQMQQAKQQKEEHDLRAQQLKQVLAAQQAQTQQRQTDATALQSAIAPRANDQYGAQLGYLLRNPPPATRDPTSSEILKSYIKGGGALNPEVLKAAQMQGPGKPMAGSLGTRVEAVPGVGSIVRDVATGEPLDSGKVIKPTAPAKRPPGDVTFDMNVDVAQKKLDEFSSLVKQYGNFETIAGNAKARSALQQLPYQLAILTAKIVDPTSVAREGEVAAAQKYLLPAGFFTSNKTTLAAIDNLKNTFTQYAQARQKAEGENGTETPAAATDNAATGGIPEYASAQEVEQAIASGALTRGGLVRVNGQLFRAQ
jgi:hypothetical protein